NDIDITFLPTQKIVELGIVYVAETRNLFPDMTVMENLELGAYNRNARKKQGSSLEYVFTLFPRLKERIRQLASTLSGGEARMLAIGRGLMSLAKFLAIDEPSLGLAPYLRIEVFNKIHDINKDGITILLVEQTITEAVSFIDRVYLLEDGRIEFEGSPGEALSNNHIKKAFLGL
ncbi:MAG: ATP-binding cassette domain-containing protein, partial [Actinobacteria bacterium]|nr:ATP-binding cassette domain-containing protein [Actinomycetota bacterium]